MSEWGRANDATAVYLTEKDTDLRLAKTAELNWTDMAQPSEKETVVFVDPAKTFQSIIGIGGALTDAAAETFFKLPAARQHEVPQAYFDSSVGFGYTLGRTHINSCDFSSDVYSYVAEGDKELATFSVEHDRKYRIPFIRQVLATAGKNFTLFASPWSPPAWMKDNNDMLHGVALKIDLPRFQNGFHSAEYIIYRWQTHGNIMNSCACDICQKSTR
jgi:glucosylceramidase